MKTTGGAIVSHESSNKLTSQENNKLTSFALTGRNYLPWARAVTIALRGCSKLGYVNGEIAKPNANDSNFLDWETHDNNVMTWLFNSMDLSIYEIFTYSETARDLWTTLKEMYGHVDTSSRIFEIQQELVNIVQTPNQSFTEHYGNIKRKWDELQQYRHPATTVDEYANVKNKTKYSNC
ncbi:UBN2_3 domain-containing protein [Cephalotus follicularis]|uniref:UBN2_3 domain-containing protein n=1 Tax=Cephalotus follicularis TaxID=3775 RepID=A0A1Q3C2A8_CEPFO|nr:UBN2_3 domain-containing protein [Cephalotus follicularis]